MGPRRYNIILHVGSEKTGSTAIQNIFYRNRERIEKYGVTYLYSQGRIDSRALASSAVGDDGFDDFLLANGLNTPCDRKKFRERVVFEFVSSINRVGGNIHTLIISSEHFQSRLRCITQLEWLKAVLEPYACSFQVVVYLRNQIEMAESFYSTQLKNATTATLEDTVRRGCRVDNFYYNHQRLLSLWTEAFGEQAITPRIFESKELHGGDVVQDFLAAIDTPISYQDLVIKQLRFNESILPFGQHILRLLNVSTKRSEHTELKLRLIELFAGKGERLSKKLAMKVEGDFATPNQHVAKQWFGKERLFSIHASGKGWALSELTAEQLSLATHALSLIEPIEGQPIIALDQFADSLRDVAIRLEVSNLPLAVAHMELAWKIRPGGPVINRKLGEYSLLIKPWSKRLLAMLTRKPCG